MSDLSDAHRVDEPEWTKPTREELFAIGAIGILVVAFFGNVLLGRQVFFWRDIHLVWVPQVETFVRAVASGSWPTWDPLTAFGQPLLADPSAQVLYPPTWLNLVVRPWVYYAFFAAGHVLFSSTGLFFLARRYGLSVAGATTSAALWLLSGPYVSLLDLWHHFASASWIPLVLLAFDKAAADRLPRSCWIAGAVLTGQVLAGSADMAALTLALVFGQILMCHVRWQGDRQRNRGLLVLVGAVLLAFGLSAGQWLPTLELARRATRGALTDGVRTYWSVHPLGLLDTLFPGVWDVQSSSRSIRAALFSGREPFIKTLYLGLPSLGMVVAALFSPNRRRTFIFLTGGLACLLALGNNTPIYGWATTLFPPIRIFRYPVKTTIVVALAWALLTGIGFDAWRSGILPSRLKRYLSLLPVGFAAALALWGSAVLRHGAPFLTALLDSEALEDGPTILARAAARLGLAGAAGLAVAISLLIAMRGDRRRKVWVGTAAALIAGEMMLQHRTLTPLAPPALYSYRPQILSALGDLGQVRLYVYDYDAFPGKSQQYLGRPSVSALQTPLEGWDMQATGALAQQAYLMPQTAGRWGIRRGYDSDLRNLYPALELQLTRALRDVERTSLHTRLLRMGGVTHVVALHEAGFEDLEPVGSFTSLWPEPVRLFRVPRTLPRSYLVDGVRVAQGLEALRLLADPTFDIEREVVLPAGPIQGPGATPLGSSRIVLDHADRLHIDAEMSRGGFLVVADSYDPGWTATVDGAAAPILIANGIFRAVALSAGHHTVEMLYRPWSVRVGFMISGSTVGLTCLLALMAGRRRRATS